VNGRGEFYKLFYAIKPEEMEPSKKIKRQRLRKGMSIFRNGRTWYCVELHHTADPNKQVGGDWYNKERAKYTDEDWDQEMNMKTTPVSSKGIAFFKVFQKAIHVAELEFDPEDVAALGRGWDFGYGFPVVIMGLWLTNGLLYCFDELRGKNEVTQRFALRVFAQTHASVSQVIPTYSPNEPLPTKMVFDWGDAEGKQRDSTSGTTDIQTIFDKFNVDVVPVGGTLAERLKSVTDRLISLIDGKPSLIIHPRCKILVEGLDAGYRMKDDGRIDKDHLYDHYVDGLSCLTTGLQRQGAAPKGFNPWAQNIEQGMEVGVDTGGYSFD